MLPVSFIISLDTPLFYDIVQIKIYEFMVTKGRISHWTWVPFIHSTWIVLPQVGRIAGNSRY